MTSLAEYETVPCRVMAVQWDGHDVAEVLKLVDARFFNRIDPQDTTRDPEFTAEVYDYLHATWIPLKTGDWIILGSLGEYYPNDNAVFSLKYRKAGS